MSDPTGDLLVMAPVFADPLGNKRLHMSLHVRKALSTALWGSSYRITPGSGHGGRHCGAA